jgi:hypothetical protein
MFKRLFGGLQIAELVNDYCGICALYQSLARLFLKLLQDGLKSKHFCPTNGTACTEKSNNRDVNGFFGWAIGSFRQQHKIKIREANKIANVTKQNKLETEVKYIDSLFIRHEDAILNEAYLKECYDLGTQMKNMGGLTLVSRRYFKFARRVMTEVQTAITTDALVLNQSIIKTTKTKLKMDSCLLKTFVHHGKSEMEKFSMKCVQVEKIYKALIEKVINAWSGEILGQYKDQVTGRRGRLAGNDQAF